MPAEKTYTLIKTGFIAAGLVNILGMLLVSQGLNNPHLVAADPAVFSGFGQLMIMVWGLAYLATASAYQQLPWLCAVFCVEKMAYVVAWGLWWMNHSEQFAGLWEVSPLTAIFIAGYGANDLAFGLLFLLAFFLGRQVPSPASTPS